MVTGNPDAGGEDDQGRLAMSLAVVLLLVAYAFIGARYLSEHKERVVLAGQIAVAREARALLPEPPVDLAERLAAARDDLDTAQSGFPSDADTTAVIDTILGLASACGVSILPLSTEPWSVRETAGYEYRVFCLDVTVEGEWPQVVAFVSGLEGGQVPALVLQDVAMSFRDEEAGSEEVSTGASSAKATLHLALYARAGATD